MEAERRIEDESRRQRALALYEPRSRNKTYARDSSIPVGALAHLQSRSTSYRAWTSKSLALIGGGLGLLIGLGAGAQGGEIVGLVVIGSLVGYVLEAMRWVVVTGFLGGGSMPASRSSAPSEELSGPQKAIETKQM